MSRREDGDVGDPPEVLEGDGMRGASEEQLIDEGHERSALPSGRDIGLAEVRDGSDARPHGNQGAVPKLKRGRGLALRTMPEGLAVGAHEVGRLATGLFDDREGRLREELPEPGIEFGQKVDSAGLGRELGRDRGAKLRGHRDGEEGFHPNVEARGPRHDGDEGRVAAVEGRSGHEADHAKRTAGRWKERSRHRALSLSIRRLGRV
ncbi:hypothetical protein D3C87_968540 [compost metagenome]